MQDSNPFPSTDSKPLVHFQFVIAAWGHDLIFKGKRISCPPHYAPPNNDYDSPHHDYEHGFPLIRSLRASTQRSTSVLFSFVLSLLIMVGSLAIRQSKTILARF